MTKEDKPYLQHDSDCSTNNRGVPELLGPCDCSVTAPQEAAARGDLQTLLTAFDMGLSFALCHRDFGDMRGAVKKLHTELRSALAAPAAQVAVPNDWRDDLDLIRACVEGYPASPARNHSMAIIRKLLAAAPAPVLPAPGADAVPVEWTPGPNVWKDWCTEYFGPDADDTYLAKAVFNLPPMAQKFANTVQGEALIRSI